MPVRRAEIEAPESRATTPSMPVPTNGASERTSGTAWRCMFEPISARLASSFSRNGMSAAATETSCFGDTSMKSTLSRGTRCTSPAWRQMIRSSVKRAARVHRRIGLRDGVAALFHGGEIDHLVGDPAVLDLAIGRLDEAVFVHPRIGRERIDQADIRAFRRLDRADAAVMRRVHVAHFEAGALARQTARTRAPRDAACA